MGTMKQDKGHGRTVSFRWSVHRVSPYPGAEKELRASLIVSGPSGQGIRIAELALGEGDKPVLFWEKPCWKTHPRIPKQIREGVSLLRELGPKPVMAPEEKAIRTMAKELEKRAVRVELLGRPEGFVHVGRIRDYVEEHLHDFYDYSKLAQPEFCIHDPGEFCGYPVDDCPNCPKHNPCWGTATKAVIR